MNYPLFVSDFDGTLLRPDGTVSQATVAAISAYRSAGGIFAVCTGRMLTSILPRLAFLGLHDGVVAAYQGATIAEIATGRLLRDEAFTTSEACSLVARLEEMGVHIHIYTTYALFSNMRDGLLAQYERVCGVKASVPEVPLSVLCRSERIVKVLIMCEKEVQGALFRDCCEKFSEEFFVTCSSPTLIEFMPKGQTKAAAIEFLGKYYGFPKERIAAIGDEKNDLPMLEAAGGRFAVANAAEELKRIATVVPSNAEDGVAYAIRKYAMGEDL